MYLSALLALPCSILLLLATPAVSEPQWPHNLPSHMKYFPEEETRVKRSLSVYERLKREKPIGVRKMSADPGEMFFLDNWIFAGDEAESIKRGRSELETERLDTEAGDGRNATFFVDTMSPLRPHIFDIQLRVAPRGALVARDFACPSGTNPCTSLGAPNSCCSTSSTCINVPDTGFGSVGCCPQGQTCAGPISCETSKGYSSCPGSSNGGCCLPGYTCEGVGCIVAGTSTTYIQPSTSAAPLPSTSTAVVVIPTTPSVLPTTTAPPSSSASTCTSGFFSCPSSLNGGCCRNGQSCGTSSCIDPTSTLSSSQSPDAPVRPTSNTPLSSATNSVCPQGFYVCQAYYPSGCCRVGSDCQTTGSCVPTASVTVVDATNGVVIIAPTGASFATTAPGQGGSCPSAWYSCAASVGGNCCPNGYACGEQCTATASASQSIVGKVAPSTGNSFSRASVWGLVVGAVGVGAGMILL